ncbi:MAG TPA: LacI family DNA-binding transcriptional regulator [Clostridiales bacterium]|nr:LacI family DNA-binding transcriptional regulator [Clostridiales bacterium]HPV02373.1 LacI family DNA-binding transcriptional regulator [Clostridiales bacterium]
MVTLKQIAEICGVSISTVSKAMNGQPDVNPATAERVRKVARDLGYRPNAAARSLKTKRSYLIGVLFADQINHEYFANVLDSIRDTATDLGYDIMFVSDRVGNYKMSFYSHSAYRNCDGVIIMEARFEDPDVVELAASDLPIVVLDHVFSGCVSVMTDNVASMVEIVHYVAGMGHRKIAFIHGQENGYITQKRIEGFYKGCMELGIRTPAEYIVKGRYHDPEASAEATKQLLSLPDPPTCIIYPDDYSYLGGMRVFEKRGLSVPEDISVVGFDGIDLASHLRPRLATYRQDALMIGKQAVIKLVEQIEGPMKKHEEQVYVRGTLLPGKSVKQIG